MENKQLTAEAILRKRIESDLTRLNELSVVAISFDFEEFKQSELCNSVLAAMQEYRSLSEAAPLRWVKVTNEDDLPEYDCLYCRVPIVEPPYVGSPISDDWTPNYYTHYFEFKNEFWPEETTPLLKEQADLASCREGSFELPYSPSDDFTSEDWDEHYDDPESKLWYDVLEKGWTKFKVKCDREQSWDSAISYLISKYKISPITPEAAAPQPKEEAVEEEILGILYRNTTDEADDGSWIESKDYYKVAKAITLYLQAQHLNTKNPYLR